MARLAAFLWLPVSLAVRKSDGENLALAADSVESAALCATEIVTSTCGMLGSLPMATSSSLKAMLSANEASINEAWEALGLSQTSVACEELCHRTVGTLSGLTTLPPASDLACYATAGQVVCDLDVSQRRLETLVPREDLPDFHDGLQEPDSSEKGHGQEESVNMVQPSNTKPLQYTTLEILVRIANLFRIFPYMEVSVTATDEAASSLVQKPKGRGDLSHWKVDVQQRNAEAQAYVTNAIRKLMLSEGNAALVTAKWFGDKEDTDGTKKAAILRVLNSVAAMLTSVDYVFPGQTCTPQKYAYVYPSGEGSKDTTGKYLFHLCQLYFDRPLEQIEVLTHEGSHHAVAYTSDVCVDELFGGAAPVYTELPLSRLGAPPRLGGQYNTPEGGQMEVVSIGPGDVVRFEVSPADGCKKKAYGRGLCERLAQEDGQKALRNADNLCYFIQDMTDLP